ncbi:hypothetical protein J4E90_010518 [Alternaria incomplexa]|uniref:uncharacterized protein n=1 Tax=Alternaria incomplexa TaxID=1187928 RepID=UPI002220D849|nr:uncharacterized protein J4E90_010518 [Alternaria incomplexa]KAI4906444.1 hypothetical protein J4E90_010518 [Alternaria incomplexa]
MSTVPALQAALNNANAQLTESNAQIAALSATLGNKNRYLIAASRELYAPTTVRGVYYSLEPMSFIGETQIVRQVPGETLEHVRYEELWSSSSPQVNPYNVEHNMYGHYGTRVPGLFISHEEVESQRYQWWGAHQRSADKKEDEKKNDNDKTTKAMRKDNKEAEKDGRREDEEQGEEKVDKDTRKKADRKEEGERLARIFEDELGLRKRR